MPYIKNNKKYSLSTTMPAYYYIGCNAAEVA